MNDELLAPLHDVLFDMKDRSYTLEEMVLILKFGVPKYIVVEALLWGFDTVSRDRIREHLDHEMYAGLLEDPTNATRTVEAS